MNEYKNFIGGIFAAIIFSVVLGLFPASAQTGAPRDAKGQQAQKMAAAGTEHLKQGTPESYRLAIGELKQAAQLYREVKMPIEAAETFYLLALAHQRGGDIKTALQVLGELETQYDDIIKSVATNAPNTQQTLARIMYLLAAVETQNGLIYAQTGDEKKSIEHLINALSAYRENGVIDEETNTLKIIGDVYNEFGKKVKAIDYFKQSLELAQKSGDKNKQSFLLNYIGKNYNDLQENTFALEYFLKALPLRRDLKDRLGEGQTLANLGKIYSDTAQYQKALEYLLLALPIRRAVKDREGEAITINNLGIVYLNLGDNRKALDYFTLSAPIFKETKDVSGEATALSNIGLIYSEMGNQAKAFEYFNRVLTVRREISDKAGEAIALNNLGNLSAQKGEPQKALDYFDQSKKISQQINDRKSEAVASLNIGTIYVGSSNAAKDAGQIRDGINEFQHALILAVAIGDKQSQAETLAKLMEAYAALQVSEKSDEADYLRTAVLYGKMSVNKYQELRLNTAGLDKNTQKDYLKKIETAYRALAGNLLENRRLPEAQQVLNAFKDQQFFDFDAAKTKIVSPLALTPREQEFTAAFEKSGTELGSLGEQLFDFEKLIEGIQTSAADQAKKEKLEDNFAKAAVLFGAMLGNGELDFGGKADAKDNVGRIDDTAEMQSILRRLNTDTGQNTVAVYQLAGQENFSALIISADAITTVSAPYSKEKLDEQALKFWGLLQSPNYDPNKLGKQIYDEVFQPLEKSLPPDTKTIIWSLDGNLRYVPMAALFDGKKYLVERYNNVIFTRADRERMLRNVSPVWTGIGFGSTKAQIVSLANEQISFNALPGVSEELRGIFKTADAPNGVIGGEVLPDDKFTKSAMLAALKTKRPLIHIASHFSFQPGDESRSFLLMGDGSALTLDELRAQKDVFAGVELLSLSACNTAAQRADAGGREIDGFAELAQRLGAGAVMATLWSVADSSTPRLMRDFYAARQMRSGMTKAEALRQAQAGLLTGTAEIKLPPTAERNAAANKPPLVIIYKNGKRPPEATRSDLIYLDDNDAPPFVKDGKKPFAHPFYWSSFVLIGNWR